MTGGGIDAVMAIGATTVMATGHITGVATGLIIGATMELATGPIIGTAITAIRAGIMVDPTIMAGPDIMTGHIVTATAKARLSPIELSTACALIRRQ